MLVPAAAQERIVEVHDDRTATVSGTFESLRDVIGELCAEADVELRAYDAADRPLTTRQERRPLAELIEHLLSDENFVVGVRTPASTDGGVRLAWLRVTGSKHSGASKPTPPDATPARADADTPDAPGDDPARRAVADRLLADDARVEQFLAAEPAALARSLGQYPDIERLLIELRTEQSHPAVIEQLDAVLAELASARRAEQD